MAIGSEGHMPGHMPSVDLLQTSQPRWRRLLRGTHHDFYHLPEYLEFAARHQDVGSPWEASWRTHIRLLH